MVMTEERTSEREDISIETARIEVNREDKKKKKKRTLNCGTVTKGIWHCVM